MIFVCLDCWVTFGNRRITGPWPDGIPTPACISCESRRTEVRDESKATFECFGCGARGQARPADVCPNGCGVLEPLTLAAFKPPQEDSLPAN